MQKLCAKDPRDRLGSNGGIEEIKGHEFFKDFDWEGCLNKSNKSPLKVNVKSPSETKYVDKILLKEKLVDPKDNSRFSISLLNSMHVDKFTFVGNIDDDSTSTVDNTTTIHNH